MGDWPAVVLVLGLCALAFGVYVVRALLVVRGSVVALNEHAAQLGGLKAHAEGVGARLKKLEDAMRIDGERLMREAQKNSLPAMMR